MKIAGKLWISEVSVLGGIQFSLKEVMFNLGPTK